MAYDNGNAKVFAELDLFSENLPKICKKKSEIDRKDIILKT